MASKIGEILVAKGLVTQAQIDEALKKQAEVKGRLGTVLVEMGAVEVDQVAAALSEQRGFPAATRKDFESATPITLVTIPAPFAQEFKAFPLRREAGRLVVAFAAPYERAQVEPVKSMSGMEVVACIAPELLLLYYQEMRYRLKRPTRFAQWSPAPTQPGHAVSSAPTAPPIAGVPAPPPSRFATTKFGVAATSLSQPPAPAQPKFNIPAPAAAAPTSPSQAPRFSILDPKPGGAAPSALPTLPRPPTGEVPVAKSPTSPPLSTLPKAPTGEVPVAKAPAPSPLPTLPKPPAAEPFGKSSPPRTSTGELAAAKAPGSSSPLPTLPRPPAAEPFGKSPLPTLPKPPTAEPFGKSPLPKTVTGEMPVAKSPAVSPLPTLPKPPSSEPFGKYPLPKSITGEMPVAKSPASSPLPTLPKPPAAEPFARSPLPTLPKPPSAEAPVVKAPAPAPLPTLPKPPAAESPIAKAPVPTAPPAAEEPAAPSVSPMPAALAPAAEEPLARPPEPAKVESAAAPAAEHEDLAPAEPLPAAKAPEPAPAVEEPPAVAPPSRRHDESATVRVQSPLIPDEARAPVLPLGETVRVPSVEPEPFSTPRAASTMGFEGPTTPISPELLAISQEPDAPPSSFFAAAPIQGELIGAEEGDPLREKQDEADPLPTLEPGAATLPAAPMPTPKRITREDLPAAILANEVETGLKVAERRNDRDHEITMPRQIAAKAVMAPAGLALESQPPLKNAVTTAPYGTPDAAQESMAAMLAPIRDDTASLATTAESSIPEGRAATAPAKDQSLAELASELSEPVAPQAKAEQKPEPKPEAPVAAAAAKPEPKAAEPKAPDQKPFAVEKTAPPPPRGTGKRPSRPERPMAMAAAAPPGGSKLGMGIGIGAVGALVVGGVIALVLWPKPAPPPPPPVVCKECPPLPPPPPEAQKVTVESVDGIVERLALSGEWVPLAANGEFLDGEQVRTGQGARAKLRVGAGMIVVGEYSRLAVRSATTAAHRFRFNAGFASFQYAAAKVPFEIELAGGKAIAAGQADLTAFTDDLRAALSPRAGSLTVASASSDKKVELAVGKQVVVAADGSFADAAPLPEKLELTLDPPKASPETRSWLLEGAVVGGPARVVVEGVPVLVDAENRFSHPIKMPAKGPFNAAAVDVAGHRLAQQFPVGGGAGAAAAAKKPAAPAPKKAPKAVKGGK